MKNDETDSFEQRLRRQPLKPLPGDWRMEILQAGRRASIVPVPKDHWLSTLNQQLSTLLWPHPKAWAGLAAVWFFILALDFSVHDSSSGPALMEKTSPPAPEVVAELKKQQQLFAELLGSTQPQDADRRKNLPPGPRSQHTEMLMT